jgi:hypothetical protein
MWVTPELPTLQKITQKFSSRTHKAFAATASELSTKQFCLLKNPF